MLCFGDLQEAAEESKVDIQAALAGADLVFVTVSCQGCMRRHIKSLVHVSSKDIVLCVHC